MSIEYLMKLYFLVTLGPETYSMGTIQAAQA